jgi:hypothetical protein
MIRSEPTNQVKNRIAESHIPAISSPTLPSSKLVADGFELILHMFPKAENKNGRLRGDVQKKECCFPFLRFGD